MEPEKHASNRRITIMAGMSEEKDEKMGIEESLERLGKIVEQLESDQTKLGDAIELYREGHILARSCREQLTEAELVVTALTDGED
jgi:exodeoxyribonuclease VII small subunit